MTANIRTTVAAVIIACVAIVGTALLSAYAEQAQRLDSIIISGETAATAINNTQWSQDQSQNFDFLADLVTPLRKNPNFAYLRVHEPGKAATVIAGALAEQESREMQAANWRPNAATTEKLSMAMTTLTNRKVYEWSGSAIALGNGEPLAIRLGFWEPNLLSSLVFAPLYLIGLLPLLWLRSRDRQLIQQLLGGIQRLGEAPQVEQQGAQVSLGLAAQYTTMFAPVAERVAQAERSSKKLATEQKFLTYRAERYEAILQTVPDGILILDEDFKTAFANQHVESLFGVSRLEIVSTTVDSWCRYQPLLDYVRSCSAEGQLALSRVVNIQDPKNPQRTLGLSAHPLYFSRSATSKSGLLVLMRDVSQEVAAKQSRQEFVGSVSHEIKAPLNTIGLYAQMLEDNGDDPKFIIDAHNTITQEVERLTRLINNLLSMTQIEMGTFELGEQRIYLAELVNECIEMLDHGEDKARIVVSGAEDISPVLVDKDLMRIAISNLMTNALKYSEDGQPVAVTLNENAETISISVLDQGAGISAEDQSRIFDKFFRSACASTQGKPGHGLGLSIVKEILNLHHGSITVESTLGSGSKFTLELWKRAGIARQAI